MDVVQPGGQAPAAAAALINTETSPEELTMDVESSHTDGMQVDSPSCPEADPQLPPPIAPTPDEHWKIGNFTLVSSDSVLFKACTYQLFSASGVFRDASELSGTEARVEFTDPQVETADVLRLFLHLVTVGELPRDQTPEHNSLIPLIAFCRKYDCVVALRCALASVRDMIYGDGVLILPWAFAVGAVADDPRTCAVALKAAMSWPEAEVPNQYLNVGKFDREQWDTLPIEYLWALARWPHEKRAGESSWEVFQSLVDMSKKHPRHSSHCKAGSLPTYDPRWVEGDLEIESGDNVLFRADRVALTAASPALRDRIEAEGSLKFDDPHTESSSVIHLLLTLLTTGKLDLSMAHRRHDSHVPHVTELALFLHKHNCVPAIATLHLSLANLCAARERFIFAAFLAAAVTHDTPTVLSLLSRAAKRKRDRKWLTTHHVLDSQDPVSCPVHQYRIWSVSAWPFMYWTLVPAQYLWALNAGDARPGLDVAEIRQLLRPRRSKAPVSDHAAADEASEALVAAITATPEATPPAAAQAPASQPEAAAGHSKSAPRVIKQLLMKDDTDESDWGESEVSDSDWEAEFVDDNTDDRGCCREVRESSDETGESEWDDLEVGEVDAMKDDRKVIQSSWGF